LSCIVGRWNESFGREICRRQMTPFWMIPPVTSEHVNDLIHVGIRGNARLAPANRSA
jgi:hypothetical protein